MYGLCYYKHGNIGIIKYNDLKTTYIKLYIYLLNKNLTVFCIIENFKYITPSHLDKKRWVLTLEHDDNHRPVL